ncbi:major facilitator superfamily domain-containing protein [Cercophora scortea]|uniref:Major facilitator superfamily domain-containing protein n=1 Tax=Cercophora scortea TaxID=314031 RepID=A0AAE0MJM7_9PEZI|nr:major facilitator superfamily domain-containing protein [Cercophora scortea]
MTTTGGYDSDLHVPCPAHTTERRIVSRIDLHVVPFLVVLYLLAFLDRVNVANARAFGLESDLHMAPNSVEYNTALTIFFVPYIVLEIPSNILLKRFSPRIWLSVCCLGFGLVSVCQGLVQSYAGLLVTRFFLGVFECGMFPGCFYLLGMWYRRPEAQKRFSLFFSSTSLAGAFGGLLASAIGNLDHVRGYRGWRWIFILEGVLTFCVGLVFLFTFPSFPEQATWLSEDERAYVRARLEADQGRNAAERTITLADVKTVMSDIKVWLGGLMYFGLIVPAYSYAYFAPTIIGAYGYSPIQTQLRSVPPWAGAFGLAMLVAVVSDWARHRFLFAILPICISIAGFAVLLTVHTHIDVEYAALFLIAAGTYSAMPVIVCWFNMNLGGHHRRAIGTAWQIGFGNIGGIIATYSFISTDSPLFKKGYSICVSFICLSAASCCLYALAIARENRRRAKAVHDVGLTEYEKTELGVCFLLSFFHPPPFPIHLLGAPAEYLDCALFRLPQDLNPEFRYML